MVPTVATALCLCHTTSNFHLVIFASQPGEMAASSKKDLPEAKAPQSKTYQRKASESPKQGELAASNMKDLPSE